MSFGTNHGDPCNNDECDMQENGKCAKYKVFYDTSLSVEERMSELVPTILELMSLSEAVQSEIKTMINIGHGIIGTDNINDILSDIEEKINGNNSRDEGDATDH